jgi:hypothetical protein
MLVVPSSTPPVTSSHNQVERLVRTAEPKREWFVLDAAAIDDIGTSSAGALRQAFNPLAVASVPVAVARASRCAICRGPMS